MPDCNEDFKLQAPLAWLDSGAQNQLRTKKQNRQITFRPRTNRYSPRADYQNADAHNVEDPTGGHHNAKLRFP